MSRYYPGMFDAKPYFFGGGGVPGLPAQAKARMSITSDQTVYRCRLSESPSKGVMLSVDRSGFLSVHMLAMCKDVARPRKRLFGYDYSTGMYMHVLTGAETSMDVVETNGLFWLEVVRLVQLGGFYAFRACTTYRPV